MKIAVSTYSFGEYIKPDSLGFIGVMDKAKEMGFEGIEIAENEYTADIDTLKRIREHSEKIVLPVVSFDVAADFTKDGQSVASEIERVKALVDSAAILASPKMRHDVAYGVYGSKHGIGFDDKLPLMVEGCRAVSEYAAEQGVMTMFENHGYFLQDSDRVEKLINAVDRDNFGYLADIGNFMCADEDPCIALGKLAKYAVHAHAKDFHFKSGGGINPGEGWFETRSGNYLRGAIIGHGDAKVMQSLKILKNFGYDGYLTIEFEGMEDNITGIRVGLENLRRYLA